jgi:biopolymer transport protein ExbD
MAKRHIPASHTAHPNVTPLIDIIMCLIIFFMLVAKIGVDTGAAKIEIPTTILGTKIKDMGNTLVLNIPGNIGDDPEVTALVSPPDGGKPRLANLYLRDGATGRNTLQDALVYYRGQKEDFKVIIRARVDLQWRFIAPVLDTCNDAGVRTIEYNTKTVNG